MIKKRITIYQCDCCSDNKSCQYKTLKSAINKKLRCGFNPNNKSCITCKYSIPSEYTSFNQRILLYSCLSNQDEYPFYKSNCAEYEYGRSKSELNYLDIRHLSIMLEFDKLELINSTYQYELYKYGEYMVLNPINIPYPIDVKCNTKYRCIRINDYYVLLDTY